MLNICSTTSGLISDSSHADDDQRWELYGHQAWLPEMEVRRVGWGLLSGRRLPTHAHKRPQVAFNDRYANDRDCQELAAQPCDLPLPVLS